MGRGHGVTVADETQPGRAQSMTPRGKLQRSCWLRDHSPWHHTARPDGKASLSGGGRPKAPAEMRRPRHGGRWVAVMVSRPGHPSGDARVRRRQTALSAIVEGGGSGSLLGEGVLQEPSLGTVPSPGDRDPG